MGDPAGEEWWESGPQTHTDKGIGKHKEETGDNTEKQVREN